MSFNRKLLILALISTTVTTKHHHHSSSEEEEDAPSQGEKIVDRLAVNLAGAFVKSMFPEMERSDKGAAAAPAPAEIRRAPGNPLQAGIDSYSGQQVASEYNAMPQLTQQVPANPFGYQQQQQAAFPTYRQSQVPISGLQSMGQQGSLNLPNIPNLLTGGSGSPEALNAVRNQAYLADLAKHQSELTTYSHKQMEYLDQQRRYQQAMIDHQAGAALLMQKQQQDIINEQMKQLKLGEEEKGVDNTVGGRVLTARARGVTTHSHPSAPKPKYSDDDVITNDEHMRQYFKDKYNITISENVEDLSEDERETLRQLKQHLAQNREKAVEEGTFKTMSQMRSKIRTPSKDNYGERRRMSPKEDSGICPQCIPIKLSMLKGSWTEMYANPDVIKKTYGTLMALANIKGGSTKAMMTSKKATCVGMEISASSHEAAKINMFYRDSSSRLELHEMQGEISVDNDNILMIDTNSYNTRMCLVKSGPSDASRYEYVVFAETSGSQACRSYHVFARSTDEFNRRHFDDVSEFMKHERRLSSILPVGAFPKAAMCQLEGK